MARSFEVVYQPEQDLRLAYANDVVAAFSRRPYFLPTKYLYDARGSELFAKFSASSKSYYPHAEEVLIEQHHSKLAEIFDKHCIVEFGSGACPRLQQLLSLELIGPETTYIGIDISDEPMADVLLDISASTPSMRFKACIGDFESCGEGIVSEVGSPTLILWLGNTVANTTEERLISVLHRLQAAAGGPLDLLLGIDVATKRPEVDLRFPDPHGYFAQFRWNALNRLNTTFHGDADVCNYDLRAEYNHDRRLAESFFVALKQHTLNLRDLNLSVELAPQDRFVVGITRDFSPDSLASAVNKAGWTVTRVFEMQKSTYALVHLHANGLKP